MWNIAIFVAIMIYLIVVAPMIGGPLAYSAVFLALVLWLAARFVLMIRQG